jgi:hypothetical protein
LLCTPSKGSAQRRESELTDTQVWVYEPYPELLLVLAVALAHVVIAESQEQDQK